MAVKSTRSPKTPSVFSPNPSPHPWSCNSPTLHYWGSDTTHTSLLRHEATSRRLHMHAMGVIVCGWNWERLRVWTQPGNMIWVIKSVCGRKCTSAAMFLDDPVTLLGDFFPSNMAKYIFDSPWSINIETLATFKDSHGSFWGLWLLSLLAGSQTVSLDATWTSP